jgi:class I fructose-bisphosphate aldolase
MFHTGRLSGTGYLSILPVDQGIEHSAGASFAKNPDYFDGENIVKLAIEGQCNAVASTLGVLGSVSRKYAHKIPLLMKFNHNELLTYPNKADQVIFASVKQAYDMGAVAVGATIYFGSDQSGRQIIEVSQAFAHAHELGMARFCGATSQQRLQKMGLSSLRRPYRPGQPSRVTIKPTSSNELPENNGGYAALNMGDSSRQIRQAHLPTWPATIPSISAAVGLPTAQGAPDSSTAALRAQMISKAVTTAVINKRGSFLDSSPATKPSSAR